MRTLALTVGGMLIAAGSAVAQVTSIRVIESPATNLTLGPRTLTANHVACTDVPTTAEPLSSLRVLAAQTGDKHMNFATGEVVVINGGTPQGVTPGQRYFTRRYHLDYDTGRANAATPASIRTTGWLTIVAADERFALARIELACDSVTTDDYLEPFVALELPAAVAPAGEPNFTDMGRVLFGADRRRTFASGDVANIDRGTAHGVGVGTRVSIYRDREIATPLVELGSGVVVEVSEMTSKVVLVRTRDAVWRGDYVGLLK